MNNSVPKYPNRVKEWRKKRGLTQEELAEKSGVSNSVLSRIESGARKANIGHLHRLAPVLGVRFSDLVDEAEAANDLPGSVLLPIANRTPVVGKVAAGNWLESNLYLDNPDPIFFVDIPQTPGAPEGSMYGLLVEGTSINKEAREGDVLICTAINETNIEIRNGDMVIVERDRGGLKEVTAKRVRFFADRTEFWPESDDPRWQEPIVVLRDDGATDHHVRIIACVEYAIHLMTRR